MTKSKRMIMGLLMKKHMRWKGRQIRMHRM